MMYQFCVSLISISIMGSVAAIVILLCKAIFGRRLSPISHLFIWLPVIVRLLVTYIPKTKLSVYNYLPEEMSSLTKIFLPDSINIVSNSVAVSIIPLIWILGLIITAIIIIGAYIFFWININGVHLDTENDEILISKMLLPYEKIKAISEEAKSICRLSKTPDMIVSKNIMSPMIAGFLCPKLVLPEAVLNSFSEEQLKLVFIHEYTHYRKKDHIMNLILLVLNILHWFNPIIWFAIRKIKKDNEDVCDEMVLKHISEEGQFLYGKTILDLTEYSSQPKIPNSPMASTSDNIKNRIKTIYSFSKKKFKVIVLPVAIIISVTLLTGAITKEVQSAVFEIVERLEPVALVPASEAHLFKEPEGKQPEPTEKPAEAETVIPTEEPVITEESTETNNPQAETEKPITAPTAPPLAAETTVPVPTPTLPTPTAATSTSTPTPTVATAVPVSTPTPAAETPKKEEPSDKVLTYRSSNGAVTARFSAVPAKSAFIASGNVKIISVSISSSGESRMSGTFNIIKDGVPENGVKGRVNLSGKSLTFSSADGNHKYSYTVQ